MKYSRVEHLEEQLLDEMYSEYQDNARGHPSVSDLIQCLTKSYWNMHVPGAIDRKTKTFFLIGFATEQALLRTRRVATAGISDGIVFHMDSLDYDDQPLDVKSTRMKIQEPDTFPMRIHKQLMSYAAIHKTTKFYLSMIYLIPAELQCWEVEYTQEEIDTHWEWMQLRRDTWNKFVEVGNPPTPFAYNEGESRDSWECKGCERKMLCDVYALKNG